MKNHQIGHKKSFNFLGFLGGKRRDDYSNTDQAHPKLLYLSYKKGIGEGLPEGFHAQTLLTCLIVGHNAAFGSDTVRASFYIGLCRRL